MMRPAIAPALYEKRSPAHSLFKALTFGAPIAAMVAITILFLLAPPIGWANDAPFRADVVWFVRTSFYYSQLGHHTLAIGSILDGIWSASVDLRTSSDLVASVSWRLETILISAVFGALTIGVTTYIATPFTDTRIHHAGLKLIRSPAGATSANRFLSREIKKYGAGILLAPGLRLSMMRELRNILLVAAPNSGKTRIILFLVEQILGRMKTSNGATRLLMHDTTGEFLRGLPLPDEAYAALHPHRAGGWAWALGRDIRDALDAFAFASRMVGPATGGENRVFDSGAIVGLTGCVVLTQDDHAETWGLGELRDTILDDPLQWKERLADVYPPAAALIIVDPETGGLNRTAASFILSFRAYVLGLLEPLAEAWRDVPQNRQFSFVEWLHGTNAAQPQTVLLLRSARHAELSAKWIGAVIDVIASYACDESYNEDREFRTYLVLDELHQLGKVSRLPEILDVGRNKQISVIAAFQDLIQPKIDYGNDGANSLIARFATKIIGQMPTSEDSTNICKTIIGSREVLLPSANTKFGGTGKPSPTPIVREDFLAYELGPVGNETKALVVGLGDITEISWPETVWEKRR